MAVLSQPALGLVSRNQIADTTPDDLSSCHHRVTLRICRIVTRFCIERRSSSNTASLNRAVTLNAASTCQHLTRLVTVCRSTLPTKISIRITRGSFTRTQRTQTSHPANPPRGIQPSYAALPLLSIVRTVLDANRIVRVTLPLGARVTREAILRINCPVATVRRAGRAGRASGGALGLFRCG